MRTEKEMLDMILETADADARIRAVTMEGSRTNPNAVPVSYTHLDVYKRQNWRRSSDR